MTVLRPGMVLTLRGDVTVEARVWALLLALEQRGATFAITPSGIVVQPKGILTPEERALFVAHRPDVLRLLMYSEEYADGRQSGHQAHDPDAGDGPDQTADDDPRESSGPADDAVARDDAPADDVT